MRLLHGRVSVKISCSCLAINILYWRVRNCHELGRAGVTKFSASSLFWSCFPSMIFALCENFKFRSKMRRHTSLQTAGGAPSSQVVVCSDQLDEAVTMENNAV
mmetsp:Transcript_10987/g.16058  ORF Transcript_10987/g.16058 Transcript_10987/m.16058 type:complete len:103 (-) Transcript_10987:472-780(-)